MKLTTQTRRKARVSRSEQGWSAIGFMVVLAAGAFGYLLFKGAMSYLNGPFTPPWYMFTLLLLPVGVSFQSLFKLHELNSPPEGLNRRERQRLGSMVSDKERQLYIGLAFYVLTAVFTVFVFWFGSAGSPIVSWGLPIVGALLGICLASLGFMAAEMREVSKFIGLVQQRERDRANVRKLRKRMINKESH